MRLNKPHPQKISIIIIKEVSTNQIERRKREREVIHTQVRMRKDERRRNEDGLLPALILHPTRSEKVRRRRKMRNQRLKKK
jgi:hypothetical protein